LCPVQWVYAQSLAADAKANSNKATLFLGCSHRYNNSTVVITIWLTVLSSITDKIFTGLDSIYE